MFSFVEKPSNEKMKTEVPKVWSVALCHHRIGVVAPSALETCGMVSEESCRDVHSSLAWCVFVALRTLDSLATGLIIIIIVIIIIHLFLH